MLLTHIHERHAELAFNILLYPRGNADPAGEGEDLEPSGNVDAIAKQIVTLGDNVAMMDTASEHETAISRC